MNSAWSYACLGFYAVSFFCYARYLYSNERWTGRLATLCVACGIVLHYLALLERSRWIHSVPYDDLYGSMSLFVWLLGATYLGLELYHRQRSVGAFVTAILLIWMGAITLLAPTTTPGPPPARGPLFALHVTLNTLAYSAFALSFALSVIYLIQSRMLKSRKPGLAFWRFPALDVLEGMCRSSVWVGLASLTLGITFGFIWEHRLSGGYSFADPKVIVTLAIFAAYVAYLWLARSASWRGSRAALICAFNFVAVLFSYTIVNFYLTGFHRFF
jgi:ABC-type transport system involved in cytochrome c biogenesis permease subunit